MCKNLKSKSRLNPSNNPASMSGFADPDHEDTAMHPTMTPSHFQPAFHAISVRKTDLK